MCRYVYVLHIYNSFVSGTLWMILAREASFLPKSCYWKRVTCKTDWGDLARGKLCWIVKDFGIFQAVSFPEKSKHQLWDEDWKKPQIYSILLMRWDGFLVTGATCVGSNKFSIRCCQASKRWTCSRKTVECHWDRGTCDIGLHPSIFRLMPRWFFCGSSPSLFIISWWLMLM